jgi:hypothetical protein
VVLNGGEQYTLCGWVVVVTKKTGIGRAIVTSKNRISAYCVCVRVCICWGVVSVELFQNKCHVIVVFRNLFKKNA